MPPTAPAPYMQTFGYGAFMDAICIDWVLWRSEPAARLLGLEAGRHFVEPVDELLPGEPGHLLSPDLAPRISTASLSCLRGSGCRTSC
jgi:hypothetical protein